MSAYRRLLRPLKTINHRSSVGPFSLNFLTPTRRRLSRLLKCSSSFAKNSLPAFPPPLSPFLYHPPASTIPPSNPIPNLPPSLYLSVSHFLTQALFSWVLSYIISDTTRVFGSCFIDLSTHLSFADIQSSSSLKHSFCTPPFYPPSFSWSFSRLFPHRLASRLELGCQVGSATGHSINCCLSYTPKI